MAVGASKRDLVLVGGGHAHIQVLRSWAMRPRNDVRLTVVVDQPVAVYSGMVPGFVAGQYARGDLEIDVRPLAMRAGARFLIAPATGVDPRAARLELAGRPAIPYDFASFDVGSSVAGLVRPGVAEYAVATRPIGRFVRVIDERLPTSGGQIHVVGAGAGGIEIAFALAARLGAAGASITLHESAAQLLPRAHPRLRRRVAAALRSRGIEVRTDSAVAALKADALELEDGGVLPSDLAVWVTGAAAVPLFGDPLPTKDGFVEVDATLRVRGHPQLFALGDCAHFPTPLPKAGVYAVRQGPVIAHNLRAALDGKRLRSYEPQRDFLSLLNTGDGMAIAAKWGVCFEGRGVFSLKDWIDRRFVRRFRVIGDDDRLTRDFPQMPGMGPDEMPCGGCAAKVGESLLERALSQIPPRHDPQVVLGLDARDDAAAVRLGGERLLVASVDAFRAFTDDPYVVGRVAAVNAASDLWAKGVAPRYALAHVTLARDETPTQNEDALVQVLAGARAVFDDEGVTLLGGHTGSGEDLAVGFSLWGEAEDGFLLPVASLVEGQALVLTKALGTGVLFHADMRGRARGEWIDAAVASMTRPNSAASGIARRFGATACTDVSGFGLAGHLGEMLRRSGVSAQLQLSAFPSLPGVDALLEAGLRSTFHPENARARKAIVVQPALLADPRLDLLFDPQTSGGLLFGVAAAERAATLHALRDGGDADARVIGTVTRARDDGGLFEVVAGTQPPTGDA